MGEVRELDERRILASVDHTLLRPTATWEEIRQICDDGVAYGCASVCIPPSYVKQASEYLAGKLPVCTVIGFPNGYSTTEVKVFEAQDAMANGASEIDLVVNLEPWDDNAVYDRFGLESKFTEIMGVKVPAVTIPVKPGRNLASIVEVAAMNNRHRKMGHNAALELTQRMDKYFEEKMREEEEENT